MKGMAITVEEIAAIKELQAQGFGPYQISAQVGADPKTVRKYMKQDDFSPAVPQPKPLCGKLAPWIPTICVWLEEDQQNRHKQRHTANMFGVGPTLGPQLIAEIGDVRRFYSKKALVAYAGLDAPPNDSGDVTGRHNSMSKVGASSLR